MPLLSQDLRDRCSNALVPNITIGIDERLLVNSIAT